MSYFCIFYSFLLCESSLEWGSLSGAPVQGSSFWQTRLLVDFLPFFFSPQHLNFRMFSFPNPTSNTSILCLKRVLNLIWIRIFPGQKTGGQGLVGGLDCTVHRNFFGSQVTLVGFSCWVVTVIIKMHENNWRTKETCQLAPNVFRNQICKFA